MLLSYCPYARTTVSSVVLLLHDLLLRYMLQLEQNSVKGNTFLLVHVFFNSRQTEVVVLAHDPVSGEVFKLAFNEDVRLLPMGDQLLDLFYKVLTIQLY